MRLFVALEIPDSVRQAMARLIIELKTLDNSWKWTRAENLHVTLKFIGHVPPEKLKSIGDALRGIPGPWPIEIRFRGLGFFPDEKRPRVLWIGMQTPASLIALAESIDEELAAIGLPREERAFTPHLTLARNKEGGLSGKLRDGLAKHSDLVLGEMQGSAFHLVESKLKSTGAEYTTLESFSRPSQT